VAEDKVPGKRASTGGDSCACLVPTLFFARTAPVAANDVPPNAKKSAKSAT